MDMDVEDEADSTVHQNQQSSYQSDNESEHKSRDDDEMIDTNDHNYTVDSSSANNNRSLIDQLNEFIETGDENSYNTDTNNEETNQSNGVCRSQYSATVKMPNIPDDFCPTQVRVHCGRELPQKGQLYNGKGANKECGRYGRALRPSEEECLKRAKRYAMEQSVKFVLQRQQQQQQKQQLDYVKKQQALMLMCRVYVGSIYYEVREDAVRSAFAPFGPIRSVSMTYDNMTNKHKGFAFIEYELPDAAQLALTQMNNAVLGGRNIKVGRPSNMPQAQPIINQLTEESKNYNRVYISSVHPGLSEQDVRCVFEAFGKVTECTLSRDTPPGVPALPPGAHRGYGFIDYEEATSANDAIASMNLFDLGGQLLRVGRAITPPDGLLPQSGFPSSNPPSGSSSLPTASAIAAANVTAKLQAYDVERSPVSSLSAINAQQMIDHAAATGTILPALMPANVPIVRPPAIIVPPIPPSLFEAESATQVQERSPAPSPPPVPPAPQHPSSSFNTASAEFSYSDAAAVKNDEDTVSSEAGATVSPKQHVLTEQQKTLLGITEDSTIDLQDEPTVKGKEQRRMLMRKLMERQAESRVMILRNMVDAQDVDDELEADINEECSKYGKVTKVVISEERRRCDELSSDAFRSDDNDVPESNDIVIKIFVEFDHAKSANNAIEAINGRWFAGRLVKADSYDQNLFDMCDYTG
ncbi:hypothetical protein GJ496_002629 [Pomphorhynchus laevis]|nr:hypothetical protein GJ496_002629 [Pomphorhynchus laevis]